MVSFRSLFRGPSRAPLPSVPAGQRIYAIGDIHGRRDLFDALIAATEADDADHGGAETTIVLLGDLIDRGPDSAGVIAAAQALARRRAVRILKGNHEEMLLDSLDSLDVLREFLRYGGRETVLSYGVDPEAYLAADLDQVRSLIDRHIPCEDIAFIASFEDSVTIGDYHFVHAGVRPGVPLDRQQPSDLRWIRGTFLAREDGFGAVVVHGHTIFAKPEIKRGRIGIDTGAYSTGCLTALGLEGTRRWLIEASNNDGAITIAQRSI
jgi:serine/threonine protein phosphatase 1